MRQFIIVIALLTMFLASPIISNAAEKPASDLAFKNFINKSKTQANSQITWDTLANSCFALTVSSTGNFGNQGQGKVNFDYWNYGDCDTVDTIPGNTEVYLYDASPVITYATDSDTLAFMSMYSGTETGFFSVTGPTPVTDMGTHNEYYSGIFVTSDNKLAVEQYWYAPITGSNHCFMIQLMKVYPFQDSENTGLSIGMVIDWDVPSDSGKDNSSGFDASRGMIYQTGAEFNQDESVECLDNDTRIAGVSFLEKYHKDYEYEPDTLYIYTAYSTSVNGLSELQANIDESHNWYYANISTNTDANTIADNDFWGGYTLDNETWIFPSGGFVPAEIYTNMRTMHETDQYVTSGLTTDLHTVMTFVTDFDLTSGGCCIGIRGNVDNDPDDRANISDLTYFVEWLFGNPSGPPPVCWEEANANGDPSEIPSLNDLTHLVSWLFGIPSGPAPALCP